MNILTADYGNSHPHYGIFQNGELKNVLPINQFKECLVPPETPLIFSSVIGEEFSEHEGKHHQIRPIIRPRDYFKKKQFLDMKVNYSETLGDDRLFQSFLVYKELQGIERSMIIDMGTFLNIEFISDHGLLGGYILPGPKLLRKTYQHGKQLNLPFLKDFSLSISSLPHSTEEAISQGLELMYTSALKQLIDTFEPIEIQLTGGSSSLILPFLSKLFDIKINHRPHLIHESLFRIYQEIQ